MPSRTPSSLGSITALLGLGLVATLGTWTLLADEQEPENETDRTEEAVAPRDAEESDGDESPEEAKPRKIGLPQPKPREPEEIENLEEKLEVEFQRPFRRVRGADGRFDVTVRVKNISGELVKGPVYLVVAGSTFEDLEVLKAPYVGKGGKPMFEVIADGKSLSARSSRGRTLKMTFATADELAEKSLETCEIDHRLTRTGLKLAEPAERSKIAKGRGRGLRKRSLPIANDDPDLLRADAAAQERKKDILAIPGVFGMGTAIDDENNVVQMVLINRYSARDKLPKEIDGVPVVTQLSWGAEAFAPGDPNNRGATGPLLDSQPPPGMCPGNPNCPTNPNLRSRFSPVIPLGAQLVNQQTIVGGRFSTGTYGFLAQRSNTTFIGSNNHVIARENRGTPGEAILQNGPPTLLNRIATLTQFVTIDFRSLANGGANRVDAAIATVDPTLLIRAPQFVTPCNGYGAMSSQTIRAQIGDNVAKCGRSTGCTQGTVTAINLDVNIDFADPGQPPQLAGFPGQIAIRGTGGRFSNRGDSGSGIVNTANGSNRATGLLFGGETRNNPGALTFANHMDDVLSALNVTLVGTPAGCPTTTTPGP